MKKGKQQHPHFKERSFGISVGGVLLLIAAYLVWRGRITAAEIVGGIGAVLLVLGLTAAAAAQVAERGVVEVRDGARLRQRPRHPDDCVRASCSSPIGADLAADRPRSARQRRAELARLVAVSGALSQSPITSAKMY